MLFIQPFAQSLARPERNHLPFGDGHGFAGARVATAARRFVAHGEGAELNEFDGFAGNHGVLHGGEHGIDNFRCVTLGDTQLFIDRNGQFLAGDVFLFRASDPSRSWD